jgi:metal-sulfur cluster biosynthetic enzyme
MNDLITDNALAWQALASIPDPEFGINIVDLGLIYSVDCADGNANVVMTLTTPTCPSGSWIHEGVKSALHALPGIKNVRVDLVFDPQWNTGMLSANARQQLGWTGES